MEATAAARGASLSMHSPQLSRQEWRAVADNHSARDAADEELERSKLQSDERTIYEVQQGREPLDVDFCSISINGNPDNDILQRRLNDVARQREDLQQMEIELRAQVIARSEILEMQKSFDSQMKERNNAAIKMQEQLCERDQALHELERKIEDKDRELQSIKLDNEAAWAKDDLLREQDKEIATYRRERDHSEAERAQQMKQMHELQEHIHEKERQHLELQEQHRIAQEAILYKDEQLREAHSWIARVQEMDALQSTTNHSLQAELRERTEQYNQLWVGCQRQFAEMERLHVHALQQLQLELADARERSGTYNDESNISQTNSKDVPQYGQTNSNQLGGAASTGNNGALSSGNSENVPSFNLTGNSSIQVGTDHVSGVPLAPSSLLGIPPYLPPGQMAALHPFLMHQPGVPHSVPSQVPQSHMGHFSSLPISSIQPWQTEQIVSEGSNVSVQNELQSSQNVQSIMTSNANYPYEMTDNGQALEPDYLDVHSRERREPDSGISLSSGETQLESVDRGYQVAPQPDTSLQHVTPQFHDALRIGSTSIQPNNEKDQNSLGAGDQVPEEQGLNGGKLSPAVSTLSSDSSSIHNVNVSEMVINASGSGVVVPEAFVSSGPKAPMMVGKTSEPALLDERALLACIVRTIPAGGRIQISSTLPNRLCKMLAPLHWRDYEKKYGKLEDFVAGHPELFVIEGDYIQLREGAQKTIAATAAFAKVAAAAAASSHYSSHLPSVAMTPMAHANRSKRIPSSDSKNMKAEKTSVFTPNMPKDSPQGTQMKNQPKNGFHSAAGGGLVNMKLFTRSKDSRELNVSEAKPGESSVFLGFENGAAVDRTSSGSSQNLPSTDGRSSANFSGKHQGRMAAAPLPSRR
ncbi:nipped-B-like protein B isoform X1 [Cucurbita maxima]|uniref:Nipped-B-like protein B isoform X1 n=1 Tax=Cucurbita maxima TaxID=3661 RepID=A0A6J1IB18_CUCMA|nr:nipped-B-like protein B isoform X1 [Cucurbita maxima]